MPPQAVIGGEGIRGGGRIVEVVEVACPAREGVGGVGPRLGVVVSVAEPAVVLHGGNINEGDTVRVRALAAAVLLCGRGAPTAYHCVL